MTPQRSLPFVWLGLVPLAGCRDLQSALAPRGPEAMQIAELSWILFGGGTVILALVVIIAWLALFGSTAARARIAGTRLVVAGGIVLPGVTLIALLVHSIGLTRTAADLLGVHDPLRIVVVGEQWWWRVAYGGPEGEAFASANEIRIPVGRPIEFTLRSADVIHSFWVPNLGGKVDMVPGRTNHLRVTAAQAGIFRGQCAEYCGGPHALMAFEIVAMPAEEFTTWRRAQTALAAEPATSSARRGRELFLAAGCGACHAVRGTPANGTIGPDLTHLGSRRRIGAASLALTHVNVVDFINEGQHLKPGNRMPSFRILASDELAAIADFLLGAR